MSMVARKKFSRAGGSLSSFLMSLVAFSLLFGSLSVCCVVSYNGKINRGTCVRVQFVRLSSIAMRKNVKIESGTMCGKFAMFDIVPFGALTCKHCY